MSNTKRIVTLMLAVILPFIVSPLAAYTSFDMFDALDPGGNLRTFGSFGSASGQFNDPQSGVLLNPNCRAVISDRGNNRLQVILTTPPASVQSVISTISGASPNTFNAPGKMATNRLQNEFYVVDEGNHRILNFVQSGTAINFVRDFAHSQLINPLAVAVFWGGTPTDSIKWVFVLDKASNGQYVIKIFDETTMTLKTAYNLPTTGSKMVSDAVDIGVTPTSNPIYIHILDRALSKVELYYCLPNPNPSIVWSKTYGSFGSGTLQLNRPEGLMVDAGNSTVYIADTGNNRIQGSWSFNGTGAGSGQYVLPNASYGPLSNFNHPKDVVCYGNLGGGTAPYTNNNWFMAIDNGNNRYEDFKVANQTYNQCGPGYVLPTATFTTTFTPTFTPTNTPIVYCCHLDPYWGTGGEVDLSGYPDGVAANGGNFVYVAQYSSGQITVLNTGNGSLATTFTGFSNPWAIALDQMGFLYVTVSGGVKKVNVTTGATTSFGAGDFNQARGIWASADGNRVYVSDENGYVYRYDMVAGSYAKDVTIGTGPGSGATNLYTPEGVVVFPGAVGGMDVVYISDLMNYRTQRWIQTGANTYQPDPGVANGTAFSWIGNVPRGMVTDNQGHLYVMADNGVYHIFNCVNHTGTLFESGRCLAGGEVGIAVDALGGGEVYVPKGSGPVYRYQGCVSIATPTPTNTPTPVFTQSCWASLDSTDNSIGSNPDGTPVSISNATAVGATFISSFNANGSCGFPIGINTNGRSSTLWNGSTPPDYTWTFTRYVTLSSTQKNIGYFYINYLADDAFDVVVNGNDIGALSGGVSNRICTDINGMCFNYGGGCGVDTCTSIPSSYFLSGPNTIVFKVTDTQWGYTGVAYSLCVYDTPQPCIAPTLRTGTGAMAVQALNRDYEGTKTPIPNITNTPTQTPTQSPTVSPTATLGGPAVLSAQTWPNVTDGKNPVKFHLELARPCRVQVTVLNLVGEPVYQVIDQAQAGVWEYPWDVRTRAGAAISSGLYVIDWQVMDGPELSRKSTRLMIHR